jgi:hypothetical protein
MLTEEKVKIYKQYHGNIDAWAQDGTKKEKLIIDDHDWYTLDNLVQDLYIINNQAVSEDFATTLAHTLKLNCINDEVIDQVKRLAKWIK